MKLTLICLIDYFNEGDLHKFIKNIYFCKFFLLLNDFYF